MLYNRYFLNENRGFTEEDFWALAVEIAGTSLPTLKEYIDTTTEIDYDKMQAPT